MDRRAILIVDPDETAYRVLSAHLSGAYEILCVADGKRALEMLGKVNIVLLARCLHEWNCVELLSQIKRAAPTLPVMVLAAAAEPALIISAFRAGADDFFKKPFDPAQILDSIRNQLSPPAKSRPPEAAGRVHDRDDRRAMTAPSLKAVSSRLWRRLSGRKPVSRTTVPAAADAAPMPVGPIPPPTAGADAENQAGIQLRANFLGAFHVILQDTIIDHWCGKKGRAILAYLSYRHKRRVSRDALMEAFWPKSSTDSARNCLHVALHGIRQMFTDLAPGVELILFRNDCYFINPDVDLTTDVNDFLYHWRLGQSIEREKNLEAALGEYKLAAALYKGDFMEEDLYEEWTDLKRENLKEIYLRRINGPQTRGRESWSQLTHTGGMRWLDNQI